MKRMRLTFPGLLLLVGVMVVVHGCGNVPGDTGEPNGGSGGGVLDSDGDGFSDDEEINGTPGTDPFDPTDNPNNVRDTDGDGCSDYDELNFDGFCDGDPNTPVSGTCDVAYYNSDFGYGFDLPSQAFSTPSVPLSLFDASWGLVLDSTPFVFQTSVADAESYTLMAFVDAWVRDRESLGAEFLVKKGVVLANGDAAYLDVYEMDLDTFYEVRTRQDDTLYQLWVIVTSDDLTDAIDAWLTDIVLSVCVD